MALKTINDTNLSAIANAIRSKNGETTTYKPSEMAAAISAISGGGITHVGKIYYSSSSARINLSSIVSDYSKIDLFITITNATSSNSPIIYWPGIEPVAPAAADYIPVYTLSTLTQSSYFIGPENWQSDSTYYLKKSEFEANGPMYLYYLSRKATSIEGYLYSFVKSSTTVLVFYHD